MTYFRKQIRTIKVSFSLIFMIKTISRVRPTWMPYLCYFSTFFKQHPYNFFIKCEWTFFNKSRPSFSFIKSHQLTNAILGYLLKFLFLFVWAFMTFFVLYSDEFKYWVLCLFTHMHSQKICLFIWSIYNYQTEISL